MKKFIFLLLLVVSGASTAFGQTEVVLARNNGTNAVMGSGEWDFPGNYCSNPVASTCHLSVSDANQFGLCGRSFIKFVPPNINFIDICTYSNGSLSYDPANGASYAGNDGTYEHVLVDGTSPSGVTLINAIYNCRTPLQTTYTTVRTLRIRYLDAAQANAFTITNANAICPSPVGSVAISRTSQAMGVYQYNIKLEDITNINSPIQVWTTGWVNGNITNYTIGSAQYNNLIAGRTYRVTLRTLASNVSNQSDCNGMTNEAVSSKTFTVNNTPTLPKFSLTTSGDKNGEFDIVYLCSPTTPITLTNRSTTAPCAPITEVKFRYGQFYGASSTAPLIYGIVETPVQTAASSYNLRSIIPNLSTSNGFFFVGMQVKTALGWSVWTNPQFINVQSPPANGALADFGFMGSPSADAFTNYACNTTDVGEAWVQNGNSCTNNDNWLSNGGTLTNPAWVGANRTALGGAAISNVYGGMQKYRVEIWNYSNSFKMGELRAERAPGLPFIFPVNGININDVPCSMTGTNPIINFFVTQMVANGSIFNTTTFQAKLIVTDVCGKEWTSNANKGFFKIIPNQPFWRTVQNPNGEVDNIDVDLVDNKLLIMPNPAQNQVNIAFESTEENEGILEIMSIEGKLIETKTIAINVGSNTQLQNINALQNGVYIVRLRYKNSTLSEKFVKID